MDPGLSIMQTFFASLSFCSVSLLVYLASNEPVCSLNRADTDRHLVVFHSIACL